MAQKTPPKKPEKIFPKIDKISWAKVKIEGQDFWQVLIVNGQVIPRKVEEIKKKYGSDHLVDIKEQRLLLSQKPEIILIANGWSGVLKVSEEFKQKVEKSGAELRVVLTPKITKEYNQLIQKGKRVNALIHTTC